VVLSRVTTLNGLFLLQPLKNNFNPQPSKLLKEEWKFQRTLEIETLLHLQQSGHFPSDIDVFRTTPEIPTTENENRIQIAKKLSTPVRKRAHSKKNKNGNMDVVNVELITTLNNFDLWLCHYALKRIAHNTPQYGNCLFESVANALPIWNGKPVELRLKSLKWAQIQVSKGTEWGKQMWK